MLTRSTVLALLVVGVADVAKELDEGKAVVAYRLEGKWAAATFNSEGRVIEAPIEYVFGRGFYAAGTGSPRGLWDVGLFSANLVNGAGPIDIGPWKGIARFDGMDILILCLDFGRVNRPSKFEGGKGLMLVTLERVKE
jgi:hypothetical protein